MATHCLTRQAVNDDRVCICAGAQWSLGRYLIDTSHPQVVQGINGKQMVSELCARHAVHILHGLAGQVLIRRHPLANLATQAMQQLSEGG